MKKIRSGFMSLMVLSVAVVMSGSVAAEPGMSYTVESCTQSTCYVYLCNASGCSLAFTYPNVRDKVIEA